MSRAVCCALLVFLVFASNAGATARQAVKIAAASAAPYVVRGEPVAITGNVTPHPAGIQLTLQQRQGTGWKSVEDGKVNSNGNFAFNAKTSRLGLAKYRVITTKGTSFVGTSGDVPVKVLHWQYLTSILSFAYIVPISGDLSTAPAKASDLTFEHPIILDPGCYNQWNGSAWIDYLLYRQYEEFTATMAIVDGPNNYGATATYTVIGGGKKLASGSLVPGKSIKLNFSVHGIYRLRLAINVPDPSHAAGCSNFFTQVAYGDAELLGP